MDFYFVSPISFEPWDWRNSVEKGIGGSETSTVENAWRLARRGHNVTSYANVPADCPGEWRGTKWLPLEAVDYSQPGVWVLYRCPDLIDKFDHSRSDQVIWLCAQDWDYPTLRGERLRHLDRLMVLCRSHEKFLHRTRPELRDKTWVTRNAIKGDLVAEIEAEGPVERNPKRIMYASSPDRGLKSALRIFQRAKEFVPDLELYATYGFDNIDKLIAQGATRFQVLKDECLALVEETGAKFLGRLTQHQLYREWRKTGLNVYCTDFFETGWITGLESQALGAIPVFSPVYAQGENTKFGSAVIGHPDDEGTIARFAAEVVRLATSPALQEQIRGPMMAHVRENWDWEQFVWQKPGENWEQAAEEDLAKMAARTTAGPTLEVEMYPGLCDSQDEAVSRARWLHLKPGDVMLDVGAADGSWSVAAALQGARVYAFDPNRTVKIETAIRRYKVADLVEPVFQLVGDAAAGDTTLDLFAVERDLPRVDFVKVDVEGSELAVLRGALWVLKKFRPKVMVEVHTETVEGVCVRPEQVETFFRRHNLPYEFDAQKIVHDGKVYYHMLCSPQEAGPCPTTAAAAAASS
jgi:glycosyltransferase involved in cell wall biosynthesis